MLKRLLRRRPTINSGEGGICLSALLDNLLAVGVGECVRNCRPKQTLARGKLGHNDLLYFK